MPLVFEFLHYYFIAVMHKVKRQFRFYPTQTQKVELAKIFGCVRFVYNHALEMRKRIYEEGGKPTYNSSSAWLTGFKQEHSFLNEVSCVPLQQSLRHLQTAYANFFRKLTKFPTFKSRGNRQSAEFTQRAFSYKNGQLSLAKIGRINVKWSLDLESEPTTVTVIKNACGQYFVTLTLLEASRQMPSSDKSIGVDLGIETFATLSDGRKFKQPVSIRKARKKLAMLQRKHSRTIKGSKRREKARVKVARAHQHVVNVRTDFLQKLSTQLVRENQTISIEDLGTSDMLKNRRMARLISEQGWRQFRDMLTYKCGWYGRELKLVNRYLPTSQICSTCGEKTKLELSVRMWSCACGATHDRDINAATNILAGGQPVTARGGRERTYVLKRSSKREPPKV